MDEDKKDKKEKKQKEIEYLEDFDSVEDTLYDSNERYDVNIVEKIEEISYEYMIFFKKYTNDECLSIGENLNYNDLFNFISKL